MAENEVDGAAHARGEARFTSPPWSVGDSGSRGDGVWIEPPDKSANVICDMVGRISDGEYTQLTDEDVANAHLIAAAPDLYFACRAALGFLESPGRRTEGLKNVLRAALAKAAVDRR